MHLERFRRHKAPVTHDQLGAGRLVIVQMRSDLAADHVALALNNAPHVGRDRTGHHTELRTVTRQMRDLRAPNLVLAGQTGDVGAGAADPATLTTTVRRPNCAICQANSLPLLPLPRTRMSNCSGWDMMFLDELLIIAQRIVVVGDADDSPPRVAVSKCARHLSALLCATPVLVCPARHNPLPVRSGR